MPARRWTSSAAVATVAVAMGILAACSSSATGSSGPTTSSASSARGTRGRTHAASTTSPAHGDPADDTGSGHAVTIAFGGDVHYIGALGALLASSPTTMLAGVRPVVDQADLTVVNLETSIGSAGDKASKAFNFQAPPAAFDALTAQGVDVIGMANNHALDFGQAGLTETLDAISAARAPVIGLGHDEAEAYRPFTATVKGQRISILAATQVIDSSLVSSWTATPTQGGVASALRVDRLLEAVRAARATSDTVVVFLHWGTERLHCPNAAQLALAPELVAAGADLVIGTHAHRIQGGGYLGHAFVEYGLGNLQFHGGSLDGRDAGMLSVTVTGRRVDSATWHPIALSATGLPSLRAGSDEAAAQSRWAALQGCAKLAPAPSARP